MTSIIETGGVTRLPAAGLGRAQARVQPRSRCRAASPELDALLGGGVERGSSTLILGPAGTGKSLLTLSFAVAGDRARRKAAMFVFDEELGLLFERAQGLGHRSRRRWWTAAAWSSSRSTPPSCRPASSPQRVRDCVEQHQAPHGRDRQPQRLSGGDAGGEALILHMHELLQYPEPAGRDRPS